MRYFLVFSMLIWSAVTQAETLAEWIAAMDADPDVLEVVQIDNPPIPLFGYVTLSTVKVRYVYTDGNSARENTKALVGINHGEQGEAWYWIGGVPEVLNNNPPEYMDAHNTLGPYTRAQIETFCNTKWAAIVASPAPIKNLDVQYIDGLTIQIYGLFNIPGDQTPWQRRSYILRFPANNSTLGQLVFERAAVE